MLEHGLGSLDGARGTAYLDDIPAGAFSLRDDRMQEIIDVPMPGGAKGSKPGRITGSVQIRFDVVLDDRLREELRATASRQRVQKPAVLTLVLDDGTSIAPCQLGPTFGDAWYELYLPER
jgi:hypothetical protein